MKNSVSIKQIIRVDEVNRHSGLSCWGNTIEVSSGDTEIHVRCTDEQLTSLRDRLIEKFPLEVEEESFTRE